MKKIIFLGVLSFMAMSLTACREIVPLLDPISEEQESPSQVEPNSQESESLSEPVSQESISEPESISQYSELESVSEESESEPELISEYSEYIMESTTEEAGGESESVYEESESESEPESISEDYESESFEHDEYASGFIVVLGEADSSYDFYQVSDYDGNDVWGGANKYIAGPLDVTAGQSIAVMDPYGTELWKNGFNTNNNVEGEGPGEYFIVESATNIQITLYEYDDGGYAYNVDGRTSSGDESGDNTPITGTGYGLLVGTTFVQASKQEGQDHQGRDQYKISKYSFHAGESFVLYDADNSAGWVDPIDSYSFNSQGSGANISTYLNVSKTNYTVVLDFTADIYIKLKWQDNNVYFELVA